MVTKTIEDKLYCIKTIIISDCTAQELEKYVEKKYPRSKWNYDEDGWDKAKGAIGLTWSLTNKKSGGTRFFVWIASPTDIFTVHHETNHLALGVLKSRGVEEENESQEAFCYYSDFWFKAICTVLARFN